MTKEIPPIFFDHLSPAAERLLNHAAHQASQRGSSTISLADLRVSLEKESPIFVDDSPAPQRDPVTPSQDARAREFDEQVKSLLHRARELSLLYSRLEPVTTKDILIALLESSPETRLELQSRGIDVERVVEEYHRERVPPRILEPLDEDIEPAITTDVLRIVDANLNRVREAIRVVEESLRFTASQRESSERIKEIRHRMGKLADFFPRQGLLRSRDSQEDVGREITTDSERSRESVEQILLANLKRSQEGLRSIEEYAKAGYGTASESAKALRYELYTLEKSILLASRADNPWRHVSLYWLFDPSTCRRDPKWTFDKATRGGVQAVQLRMKGSSDRELIRWGRTVRAWCRSMGVLFIMNDRADLARLCEADAVHLGQDDLSVRDARRVIGPDMEVGVSTHSLDEAKKAFEEGVDYIGVGPIFPSSTKAFDNHRGVGLIEEVAQQIDLPSFALGGIGIDNVGEVIKAGARRIAVGHAIQSADDPQNAARSLYECLESNRQE